MSVPFRAGLIVLGLLSVFDLALPLITNGQEPPMAVALVAAGLGLASIALIVSAWRGASRAVPALVVLRVLSAAAAVPAFFMPEVPTEMVVTATGIVALTVLGLVLVLVPSGRPSTVSPR